MGLLKLSNQRNKKKKMKKSDKSLRHYGIPSRSQITIHQEVILLEFRRRKKRKAQGIFLKKQWPTNSQHEEEDEPSKPEIQTTTINPKAILRHIKIKLSKM